MDPNHSSLLLSFHSGLLRQLIRQPFRHSQLRGDLCGGVATAHPFARRACTRSADGVFTRPASAAPAPINSTSSPRGGVSFIVRAELADRSSSHFLELFGHFAGHDRRPAADSALLEVDESRRPADWAIRTPPPYAAGLKSRPMRVRRSLPVRVRKPKKVNRSDVEPRRDERRQQRRRAGNRNHAHAGLDGRARPAATPDPRGAAFQRPTRAPATRPSRAARRGGRRLRLVVLVVRDRRRRDLVARRAGSACVACPRREWRRRTCSTSTARKEKSPMLPMGVLTT